MTTAGRRARERAERRALILDTARRIAEADGWAAVTTRRLAEAIEYSQPVLYSHFAGMTEIADAVALEGFTELAEQVRAGVGQAADPAGAPAAAAHIYLRFAEHNPAVYSAMFSRHTALTFAEETSPEPLRAAFAALSAALEAATAHAAAHPAHTAAGTAATEGAPAANSATTAEPDLATRTELFWSALHGLATLTAGHRLRPAAAAHRLELLISQSLR